MRNKGQEISGMKVLSIHISALYTSYFVSTAYLLSQMFADDAIAQPAIRGIRPGAIKRVSVPSRRVLRASGWASPPRWFHPRI